MLNNLLANWKTTSAGLGMAAAAVIHLAFSVKAKTADENTWTTAFLAVLGGVGLVAAGDAGKSATKEDLQQVKQEVKQESETAFVKKSDIPQP
jgi:peptidoglycan/LPS O-acetylase OafA/YrhL